MQEKSAKQRSVESQAAFLSRPERSQVASASSNSTVRMRIGLAEKKPVSGIGWVSSWRAFRMAAARSNKPIALVRMPCAFFIILSL